MLSTQRLVHSLKLTIVFLRYSLVSLFSFSVDVLIFALLYHISYRLLLSMIVARVVSACLNFSLNKFIVYRSLEKKLLIREAIKYTALAFFMFLVSYFSITELNRIWHIDIVIIRILIDLLLFFANFVIQRLLFRAGTISTLRKIRN